MLVKSAPGLASPFHSNVFQVNKGWNNHMTFSMLLFNKVQRCEDELNEYTKVPNNLQAWLEKLVWLIIVKEVKANVFMQLDEQNII